jgi:hypothetical protein
MDTTTDYTRLPDRNGEPIACHHSWHYEADGSLPCRGDDCKGQTVACGQGAIDCARHLDRAGRTPARQSVPIRTAVVEMPGRAHGLTLGLIHANCATLTLHFPTPLGNMTTESAYLTRTEVVELAGHLLDFAALMPTAAPTAGKDA